MKLTEAQQYALTGYLEEDNGGVFVVRRRYRHPGAASATLRKLHSLGLLKQKPYKYNGYYLSAKGIREADKLFAAKGEGSMRQALDAYAEANRKALEFRENRDREAVELAQLVATRVPEGIYPDWDGETLRDKLAKGTDYGKPITVVSISVRGLGQILGLDIPDEPEEGEE